MLGTCWPPNGDAELGPAGAAEAKGEAEEGVEGVACACPAKGDAPVPLPKGLTPGAWLGAAPKGDELRCAPPAKGVEPTLACALANGEGLLACEPPKGDGEAVVPPGFPAKGEAERFPCAPVAAALPAKGDAPNGEADGCGAGATPAGFAKGEGAPEPKGDALGHAFDAPENGEATAPPPPPPPKGDAEVTPPLPKGEGPPVGGVDANGEAELPGGASGANAPGMRVKRVHS